MNMSNIATMPDERSGRLVEEILSLLQQAQPPLTLVSALGVLECVKYELVGVGDL